MLGLGIGTSLVKAAIERSKELGYKSVYLETSDVQVFITTTISQKAGPFQTSYIFRQFKTVQLIDDRFVEMKQESAMRIYERVGFELVGSYMDDTGFPIPVPQVFHGILVIKYMHHMQNSKTMNNSQQCLVF